MVLSLDRLLLLVSQVTEFAFNTKLCFESLLHPPYSPDLASSDYFLFQTSRDGCVVGVLSRIKKLNEKQKGILEGLTNCIIWKA